MEEQKFPKKDSKGRDITPRITKSIVRGEEIKDSPLKKAAKMFFSEDIDHVTDSIVDDFVKPRATSFGMDLLKKTKEFLYNSIMDFFGSIFFGSKPNNSSYRGNSYTSYSKYGKGYSSYNYNSYYDEPDNYYYVNGSYYKNTTPPEMIRHDIVRERLIKEAGKAQEAIDDLRRVIRTTADHFVAVGDYYVLIGIDGKMLDPLDYEYGWIGSMLDGCKPRFVGKGYVLDLPNPVPKPR